MFLAYVVLNFSFKKKQELYQKHRGYTIFHKFIQDPFQTFALLITFVNSTLP